MSIEREDVVGNSIILVFVRVITMSVSVIQTMILSRTLTQTDYGTYSQALLIISFFSPFFSLGLENAINYYYNKAAEIEMKEKYINTIFMISAFSGLFCGVLILVFQTQLVRYFGNAAIFGLTFFIAFRPCLQNLIALYQPLFISSGYAKTIATRNLVISIAQIGIVVGVLYFTDKIELIFLLMLLLDMFQVFCFAAIYRKRQFAISVFKADFLLIRQVLKYAVPMLLAASLSTISLNIDKLMISGLISTEEYALYSNVSKELPFAYIVSSITAVVTPLIIQYISEGRHEKFKTLWSSYLEIGYMVTWPLCVGAAILAPEMIEVLYSRTYLSTDGIIVFQIYIVVSMMRFTYFGMIPTALGRTDIVLKYSGVSCLLNVCLNYPMYLLFGMPGPAVATVVSLAVSIILYFATSIKLVNISLCEVLNLRKILRFLGQMVICGGVVRVMISAIEKSYNNAVINLLIGYFLFNVLIFGWNYKGLKFLLVSMRKRG